jgi:hypothetical protein
VAVILKELAKALAGLPAMNEPLFQSPHDDQDIARHEVSEDGIKWRPFDPKLDYGPVLHRRIEFRAPRETDSLRAKRQGRACQLTPGLASSR